LVTPWQPPQWQIAAYYGPARAVGGDFYDFIEMPGGRIGIAVGDVTDKGVPAALVMARTHSILRAEASRSDSPGEILARANALLVPEMPARMFVTCLFAILDPRTGRAKGASSTWLNGRPVEDDLRAVLGRDVRTANDADCLAVSEAIDGAGRGHHVVFAVILGSGAGAGIAVGGRAHHGPNTSAGEWGHNPLPFPDVTEIPGAACYCGRHGCLETWVSGRAFAREFRRHAEVDLGEPVDLAPAQIVARMREGDRLARLVWSRYVDRVARGLSLVVNILDPDVLVMGGGMSNVGELYDELPGALASYVFSPVFHTPVVRAAHGDSSGVRGAARLWSDDG